MTGDLEKPRATLALVDDSDEVRALVRTRLQLAGFEIVGEGCDGTDAIGLAYRHEPQLLLLDTSMPTMDGLEALPAILALAPDTKVVMYTGFGERGLADAARDLGASDFIEKSLPIDELPDRLWRVLAAEQDDPEAHQRRRSLRAVRAANDERGAAEQEVLDEHLERFREVFDQATIGMATLTLNGSVVRANSALATMMQCEPDDLVGVDYGQLSSGHGDELDQGLEAISLHGEDLVEFEHPLPGGEGKTVRVILAPIRDSKRHALYVFAQIQDITAQRLVEAELRRSEEMFRLLVNAVSDYAIFMLDPHGHVISWNAGAERIKGYTADEIIGRHFRVFYPAEERETHHPERNLELALRNGVWTEEAWRIRKDGTRFWASVVLTAVYDDDGRHIGFAKVTRDQTEQRLAEEQRRRAVEQQTHLLAVTAHELRTPTAVIEGSATMLLDHAEEVSESDRAQLLAAIGTSAHRLQRLVTDLATASRLETETLRLQVEPLSLRALADAAVDRLHAANAGVEVSTDISPDVDDATIVGDAGRLGQMLDNLLDNAVRHGLPPVHLGARLGDSEVVISVADAGSGVPAELLPRLFDRFAIAGPTGGTGLGLYLVRELARGHGGEVAYEPPRGDRPSRFVVRLPLTGGPASGPPAAVSGSSGPVSG